MSPLIDSVRARPARVTLTSDGPKVWLYSDAMSVRRELSAICLARSASGCSISASSKRSVALKLPAVNGL